jgi:hypothetical protein
MSFFQSQAFTPTPGTAYENFRNGVPNPMIPQDMYRPAAAGPAYLAGLSGHRYYAPLRQMRLPLQGLGDPISDLLGGSLDKVIETVIVRSMPIVHREIKPTLLPLQVVGVATLVASVAAAGFAFAAWRKTQ